MAAFSHHPFLVDSTFFPNSTIAPIQILSSSLINTTSPPSPPQQFHHQDMSSNIVTNQETRCVDHQNSNITTISDTTDQLSVTKNHNNSPETSSMVVDNLENGEQITQKKKRKTRKGYSSLSSTSKDSTDQERNKKQKKSNGGVKGSEDVKAKEEIEKKKEQMKMNKGGCCEEPPTGYIHVRARRGQATDSHSLAERVRREKISERMKMLQRLVPGCDKVTGKALVLDEIINYVQSLQNQVEFLSMKLASVNPMFFDLTMDLDTFFIRSDQKLNSMAPPSPPLPYAPQRSPNQGTTFADTNTPTMTSNFSSPAAAVDDYLLDYSSPNIVQGQQRPNVYYEYASGQFWEVEDQRQKCLNPYGLCSLD